MDPVAETNAGVAGGAAGTRPTLVVVAAGGAPPVGGTAGRCSGDERNHGNGDGGCDYTYGGRVGHCLGVGDCCYRGRGGSGDGWSGDGLCGHGAGLGDCYVTCFVQAV